MQRDALWCTGVARPEPRPFVRGLVLQLQPDDVAVEARGLGHVLDDQDELREAPRAHARCCESYVPNSSLSALQISPTVARARSASRIGTSRFPSPRAVSRTAATACSVSSAFRFARTRAVLAS